MSRILKGKKKKKSEEEEEEEGEGGFVGGLLLWEGCYEDLVGCLPSRARRIRAESRLLVFGVRGGGRRRGSLILFYFILFCFIIF